MAFTAARPLTRLFCLSHHQVIVISLGGHTALVSELEDALCEFTEMSPHTAVIIPKNDTKYTE